MQTVEEVMPAQECRKRLVLADENTYVRRKLKHFLHILGFEVVEARNGFEAVHLSQRLRPELVVLDIFISRPERCDQVMKSPAIGLEVIRELKARCPETSIIIFTMHSEHAYVADCISAGVSAYVLKTSVLSSLKCALLAACNGAIILGRGVVRTQI